MEKNYSVIDWVNVLRNFRLNYMKNTKCKMVDREILSVIVDSLGKNTLGHVMSCNNSCVRFSSQPRNRRIFLSILRIAETIAPSFIQVSI